MGIISALLSLFLAAIAYGGADGKDILSSAERVWLTNNQSRLVLAVETGYAPFVFLDDKGRPTGLAHDYLLLIESKLGVHFKQRRFSSLDEIFDKVRSGEVQIVNAVTNTPARSRFLAMTEPFISVPNVIIVRKDQSGAMTELKLAGLKVSLVKSYAVTEHMTNRGLQFVPDIVPDDLTALLNVSFGRSDAAIVDLATASYLISVKGITNLRVAGEVPFDIRLSIGSPIGEPVLHSILQKGLNAATDAERDEIKKRWINTSNQSIYSNRQFWVVLGGVLAGALVIFAVILVWNRTLRQQVAIRTDALVREKEALRESEAQNLALVTQYNRELERQIAERTAELSEVNRKLQQLSEIDGLTGIANRRKFDAELDREWRRAIREKRPLALLMVDIDHFKEYNDRYGHPEGDRCLQLVAEVLHSLIQRTGELVARYGGEEFVVILPGHSIQTAGEVAEKIRYTIEARKIPHLGNVSSQVLTISVGVASMVPDQAERPDTLLNQADACLYEAKREGRNRVVTECRIQ
ncbi:hypothetical protein SKTS_08400 [Sulfurimicrobium lacus]|uniref:diguanylate cyclase n=1 Tax=Sulfurimicrobium lacus TaxID=2715678 RepID=A0A6F8V8G8_9PROT|nr:diguanylate cyclase [Sulfurimicrobium lacus]BCB25954.1 hypothetical protein SKTS_08400 [Sulfurimicrobium lacus]